MVLLLLIQVILKEEHKSLHQDLTACIAKTKITMLVHCNHIVIVQVETNASRIYGTILMNGVSMHGLKVLL